MTDNTMILVFLTGLGLRRGQRAAGHVAAVTDGNGSSNGRARGLVVPIGTVLGIAGTLLLAMLGYASQQFNNLRRSLTRNGLWPDVSTMPT